LLLDRRRINKWAKWVALFLAIVFAGGFLFLGVGYGGSGFNLSSIFTGSKSTAASTQTSDQQVAQYEAALAQNPNDITALLALATIYQSNNDLKTAAGYLERVIAADPSQKDIYLRLAAIYLNANVADYGAAVTVLNKLTSLDPNNPDVYLDLGIAQNRLGQTEAAILAWQRYLQLAPNGDQAANVKAEIETLSKKATTTTAAGATSTTTAGSTATTAGTGTTAGGSSSTMGSSATSTSTTTSTAP
jgi:cytochrome c-type biogenesis protein CcmH/NrfG